MPPLSILIDKINNFISLLLTLKYRSGKNLNFDFSSLNLKRKTHLALFYYRALIRQSFKAKKKSKNSIINYYEFGVGGGNSLLKYIKALKMFSKISKTDFYSHHIFGFDSFEGLPEKKSFKDDFSYWDSHDFAHEISEIKQLLTKEKVDLDHGNIHFIKGFYEDSLTFKLRDELKSNPPAIIMVDCDYYSSTKIILEWLRPFIDSDTIFIFDDIFCFNGDPNKGELAAINEFNNIGKERLIPVHFLGLYGQVFIYTKKRFEKLLIKMLSIIREIFLSRIGKNIIRM